MKVVNLIQGTPEWHDHRAQHKNASDAPAMLGCSPYKTRTELLNERLSGIKPEVDAFAQKRFDDGHRFEALARTIAEDLVGEELFPVTGVLGEYSASFDGRTMDGEIGFEHKSLNQELRDILSRPDVTGADLPKHYRVQMEQQCLVGDLREVFFMASKWTDDDELDQELHCWYSPDPELRAEIVRGWYQFDQDLTTHSIKVAAPKLEAEPVKGLPALLVRVEGRVVATNLDAYRAEADKFFGAIKTELVTDQDFVDADAMSKTCQEIEDRLAAVKDQALAQTASIDELFKVIDHISATARSKRLALDKLVTAQKDLRKANIVNEGKLAVSNHIADLTTRLGGAYLPPVLADFASAIKGKRTLAGVQEAVNVVVAGAKAKANEVALQIETNRKLLTGEGHDYLYLFPDFAQVCVKSTEDFAALFSVRVQAEKDRKEAERKRVEAEVLAKAELEKQVAAKVEQPSPLQEHPSEPISVDAAVIANAAIRRAATPAARAVVVEHQDEISLFLATVNADAKTKQTVRSYLVEFVKFQAANQQKKAA